MQHLLEICYLIGSFGFIIGLKLMGQPDSARKGNLIAAFGMAVAVFATLFLSKTGGFQVIGNIGYILAAMEKVSLGGTPEEFEWRELLISSSTSSSAVLALANL